jgi:hypothetical protein
MTRNKRQRKLAALAVGRCATSVPLGNVAPARRAPSLRRLVPRHLRLVTCPARVQRLIASLQGGCAASASPKRPALAGESTGAPTGRFRASYAMAWRGWCARYHSPSATYICPTITLTIPWLKTGSTLDQCALYTLFSI